MNNDTFKICFSKSNSDKYQNTSVDDIILQSSKPMHIGIDGFNDCNASHITITNGRTQVHGDLQLFGYLLDSNNLVMSTYGGSNNNPSNTTFLLTDGIIENEHIRKGVVTLDRIALVSGGGDHFVSSFKPHVINPSIGGGIVLTPGQFSNNSNGDVYLGTTHLQDASVTEIKIADMSVTTDKITSGAVVSDKIADGQILNNHILAGSLNGSKLSLNSVNANCIIDNTIDTKHIKDIAITANKIDNNAVSTIKIQDKCVTNQKLADLSITNNKIQNGTITADKLSPNFIYSLGNLNSNTEPLLLEENSVTTQQLANSSVTTEKIQDGTITYDKLSPSTIESLNNISVTKTITSNVINEVVYHQEKLDVAGDIRTDAAFYCKEFHIVPDDISNIVLTTGEINLTSGDGSLVGVGFETNNNIVRMVIDSNKDFYFSSSSYTDIMTLNNDTGNVGIGTTNPVAKLDVNGDIRAGDVKITGDLNVSSGCIYNEAGGLEIKSVNNMLFSMDVDSNSNTSVVFTPFANPTNRTPADTLMDGSLDTKYEANSPATNFVPTVNDPIEVGATFSAAIKVTDYVLKVGALSNYARTPRTWKFELKQGQNWVTIHTIENQTWSQQDQERTYTVNSDVKATGARLLITDNNGAHSSPCIYITELSFLCTTTAMVIKDDGNVGIGTNNPQAKLHVNGDTVIDGELTATTLNVTTINSNTTTVNAIYVDNFGNGLKKITNVFGGVANGTIQTTGNGNHGWAGYNIHGKVSLLAPAQGDSSQFQIYDNLNLWVFFEYTRDQSGNSQILINGNLNVQNGNIYSNGTQLSSDDRVKSDEVFITNALSTVKKIQPQEYNKWNTIDYASASNATSVKESGIIAQELYIDVPELRHLVVLPAGSDSNAIEQSASNYTTYNDLQNDPVWPEWSGDSSNANSIAYVNYTGLIPYTIEAIKELSDKLDAANNIIASYETIITNLQMRIDVLEKSS